jgi:hypothetical protein
MIKVRSGVAGTFWSPDSIVSGQRRGLACLVEEQAEQAESFFSERRVIPSFTVRDRH